MAPPSSLVGRKVAYSGARCHRSDSLPPLCCPPVVLTSSICITWGLVRSRISGPTQPYEASVCLSATFPGGSSAPHHTLLVAWWCFGPLLSVACDPLNSGALCLQHSGVIRQDLLSGDLGKAPFREHAPQSWSCSPLLVSMTSPTLKHRLSPD